MLFVISAPSGAGKTTIIKELFKAKAIPNLRFSVSATTRNKRQGETEGKDYHFLSIDEFNQKRDNNEFVEFEEVHGNYYGTLKREVEPYLESMDSLIFDVDVKGALSIKSKYPKAVTIFINVPIDELVKRLKNRKTESEEEIERRRQRIELELKEKDKFDYIVDNTDSIDKAAKEIEKIINNYN